MAVSQLLPIALPMILRSYGANVQQYQILQSFSLLLLGAILSMMATLNFSLALVIGLAASPLSFVRPLPGSWLTSKPNAKWSVVPLITILMLAISPPSAVLITSHFSKKTVTWLLVELAKGWSGQGAITNLVIWCVWWPAWMLAALVLYSGLYTTT